MVVVVVTGFTAPPLSPAQFSMKRTLLCARSLPSLYIITWESNQATIMWQSLANHDSTEQNQHCNICVFASLQISVTTAPAQIDFFFKSLNSWEFTAPPWYMASIAWKSAELRNSISACDNGSYCQTELRLGFCPVQCKNREDCGQARCQVVTPALHRTQSLNDHESTDKSNKQFGRLNTSEAVKFGPAVFLRNKTLSVISKSPSV